MRRGTRCSTSPCSTWRRPSSTMPPPSSASASSQGSATARSGARAIPSRMPAPTWPVCRRGRRETATATSSTGRRSGPAGPVRPTGACSSSVPILRQPSTRASAAWWSTCTRPGIEVRPIKQAWGPADFNEVFFDDVVVPVENRIGPEHEGWGVAQGTLGGRAGHRHPRDDRAAQMPWDRGGHPGVGEVARSRLASVCPAGRCVCESSWRSATPRSQVVRHVLNQMIDDIIRGSDVGGMASIIKVLYSELLQPDHAVPDRLAGALPARSMWVCWPAQVGRRGSG